MQPYEFITSPAERGFLQVAQEARKSLFIATPYLKDYGVQLIVKSARPDFVRLLTNLDMTNITGLGFDINALLKLWDQFELQVSSLGKLHAKVYVADQKIAFVTSANLTRGGLVENYEYGVILRDEQTIARMLEDMTAYFNLGNLFSRDAVEGLQQDVKEIRGLQKELDKSTQAQKLRRTLGQKENALKTKILTNRTTGGRTVNAIFAETIIYLLQTRGPLTTVELHPLVQNIHPDICDDTINRVINGQHFGKKWKHMVRNAQQYLKQRDAIEVHNGKWQIINS